MSEDNAPNLFSAEQDLWALRKPTWDTWNTAKQARLWHAVALACDLDPGNFQLFNNPQLARPFKEPPRQFDDLLVMAKGSIGANSVLKLVSRSNEGLEESEVKLSNFATWLKSIQHKPPAQFPWLPEPVTFRNMDWPWGGHETELLRKLAAAAQRFWSNYDPSDSDTAPTNVQVIDWLKCLSAPPKSSQPFYVLTVCRWAGANNTRAPPRQYWRHIPPNPHLFPRALRAY